MRICPKCKNVIVVTRAMKGRLRHGAIEFKCKKCGCQCMMYPNEEDVVVSTQERREMGKIMAERKYYGLCLSCGEPTKNSARYCEKCRKEKGCRS